MIADRVRSAIKGDRKASLAQLVKSMEEPATEDLRAVKVLPIIDRAIGHPQSTKLRRALSMLASGAATAATAGTSTATAPTSTRARSR